MTTQFKQIVNFLVGLAIMFAAGWIVTRDAATAGKIIGVDFALVAAMLVIYGLVKLAVKGE